MGLLPAIAGGIAAWGQQVIATFPTAPNPYVAAVNSVTNKIYVVNDNTNGTVTVIDGLTNSTATVTVGANPDAIDVNMVTDKIYVANSGSNTVTVIDGATLATTSIAVAGDPTSVAVNPVTNRVYVSNNTFDGSDVYGAVTVIDGATNAAANIDLGSNPSQIVVNSATDKIYFMNNTGKTCVTEIDGATNSTSLIGPLSEPAAIALNTVTNKIYLAIEGNDVLVIDAASGAYSFVGHGIDFFSIAVNAATNKAYAVNDWASGSVTVVDGATSSTAVVPTGLNPGAIAVNPVTNMIYVVNGNPDGTVTVIDGATNATTTVPVGAYPGALAVNPATDRIYVLNNDAKGTVSVIDGTLAAVAPAFGAQPQSQTVNAGASAVFSAAASAWPSPTFQWSFDGAPLSDGPALSGSSTSLLYLIGGATAASAGTYTCTATNGAGSVTSAPATLTVVSTTDPGRMTNLSTRAYVDGGAEGVPQTPLFTGFVVSGQGSIPLILRGVGPTLSSFGVSGALNAPVLSLYDSASPANLITEDSGWQTPVSPPAPPWAGRTSPVDATAADFAQVGAFQLLQGSADCAIKVTLPAGAYTTQVTEAGFESGVALAEIYDADPTNPGTQLINVSSRATVATGSYVLIAGLVISGSTSETVLIRASGPALATFGVGGVIADPQLQVFDANQNLVASNFYWGGNPQISAAASKVGAFEWTDPLSADSAVLISLPPGNYTAEVSSQSGGGGDALLEVYAVP